MLTHILVSALWVFFRADNIGVACDLFKGMFFNGNDMGVADLLAHDLDIPNVILLLAAMAVMAAVDIALYKGVHLIYKLFTARISVRWIILYALIFSVIIFGIYGPGYDAARFIYDKS